MPIMRLLTVVLVALFLAKYSLAASVNWEASAIKNRLRADWEKLESIERLSTAYRIQGDMLPDDSDTRVTVSVDVKHTGSNFTLTSLADGQGSVVGLNSKYYFIIQKPSAEPNWKLKLFYSDLANEQTQQVIKKSVMPYRLRPLSTIMFNWPGIYQKHPAELLADPKFKILSGVEETPGQLRVSFSYPPYTGETCYFIVDLQRHCAVTKVHSTVPNVATAIVVERRLDEQPKNGEVRVKELQFYKLTQSTKSREETFTLTYTDPPPTVPEYEFTLSHYGLPEPEGVVWEKPGRGSLLYWLAGGGLLFVLVGSLILRRLRRTVPTTAKT